MTSGLVHDSSKKNNLSLQEKVKIYRLISMEFKKKSESYSSPLNLHRIIFPSCKLI